MDQSYFVKVKNLKKSFGKKRVLNGLDLLVPRGKISFIIGRSGEGKSVTIKHMVGILQGDSGEIFIDGKEMQNATAKEWQLVRKKIGILFQDGALFDSMNVFDNISFPLVNHLRLTKNELKNEVHKLLSLVDLAGIEGKMPSHLSIGERKRVGLARALALKPQLLLYDEPTTGMDPLVSDLIDKLIVATQREMNGITSVVISHDIHSVMEIAEHIFLLHEGKVYFEGCREDFIHSSDPLVHQFLTGGLQGPLQVPLV